MRVLGAPAEAEDLTQEIFLTLCTKCDYDPSRGSLSAFLVTLTRSRAIDKIRARTRKSPVRRATGRRARPRRPVPRRRSTRSRSPRPPPGCALALATLPDTQRRVLEMSYYRGLSQTEIAAELDSAARHREELDAQRSLEPPRLARAARRMTR